MFSKAKWVWHPENKESDTYIEFIASCECKNSQEAVLRIQETIKGEADFDNA